MDTDAEKINKFYRLKSAMKKVAEACSIEALPADPNILLAMGVLAPNLGDVMSQIAQQIIDVADILDEA